MKVAIIGGYGAVGSIIARLASEHGAETAIAGRSLEQAQALARTLPDAHGVFADVRDTASVAHAVADAHLIFNCIDQEEPVVLRAAIEQGSVFVDVAVDEAILPSALAQRAQAEQRGATVLLNAGLVPGLTNVMARRAVELAGGAGALEINMVAGVGEDFGKAAWVYLLRVLSGPARCVVNGTVQTARCLIQRQEFAFPAPAGRLTTFLFPFPPTEYFPRTLGVQDVQSRGAVLPPVLGETLAFLSTVRLLKPAWLRPVYALRRLLPRSPASALTAVGVVARERARMRSARLTAIVHGESRATAVSAWLIGQVILADWAPRPGVFFPEEVIEPGNFFAQLMRYGIQVQEEVTGDSRNPRTVGDKS